MFSPVSVLISIHSISACHVSNERKQISAQIYDLLFFSRGYTLRVMMEWIYCIIVTFFAHCTTGLCVSIYVNFGPNNSSYFAVLWLHLQMCSSMLVILWLKFNFLTKHKNLYLEFSAYDCCFFVSTLTLRQMVVDQKPIQNARNSCMNDLFLCNLTNSEHHMLLLE